ncbi:MAG: alpha-hydroxy-acid oxidizing protein [Jatrophihabitans sp.]|nr:MAG: alpha-hydroxy-acid oxidizing protein [Jatrophihabitans sp.]
MSAAVPLSTYATEIYLHGLAGVRPAFTTDPDRLEAAAREAMSPETFGYVAGAASSGSTARENRAAFDRWRIVPRMLTGATSRDLTTPVLGSTLRAPVLTAPIGVQSIVHPDAELAAATVTAELGIGMIVSTLSSRTLEEVADAHGDGCRWFQLYWPNDDDVCRSLLRRANAAGYTVLVVTLDTWLLGWRPHDLDHGYLPFLTGEGLANYFSDEAFCAPLARPPAEDPAAAVQRWVPCFTGTDRTWDQIAFLQQHWDGPIVLKGVQHPADAERAAEVGVQGIVVSNHGGRQVDGAVASLEALPRIVEAVGSDLEVLFDSGIRTGSDVLKALALGARAVLVGRPWVYGLGLGGTDGVRHVLRGLLADTELAFGLSGNRTPACLTRDALVRRP